MSDYTLQVSKDARIEISAIKRFIKYKLKNVQAADNFYEDTRKAFEHILENPYAHQVKDSSEEIDGFPKRQFNTETTTYCTMWSLRIGISSGSLRSHILGWIYPKCEFRILPYIYRGNRYTER